MFAFTLANYFKYETQSYLDIGEIDYRFYNEDDMIRCKVDSNYYWSVSVQRIYLSDKVGDEIDLG